MMAEDKEWSVELSWLEASDLDKSIKQGPLNSVDEEREPSSMMEFSLGFVLGVKVEVFSNEHPPPHFRVEYQGSTANYRIADCRRINGSGEVLKYEKNIKRWHKKDGGREKLIDAWNDRRPNDCTVGKFEP